MSTFKLGDVWVVMPLGGRATRAKEVTKDAVPKHLLRLDNGETILSTVCRELQRVGFRRFVFCVGYLRDQIVDHIQDESWIWKDGVSYLFSEEDRPLGPDGAVLAAIKHWQLTGQAMMIPGDILLPWDEVANMHVAHSQRPPGVTSAVTSHEKRRMGELGRFVIETSTSRLRHVYGRGESVPPVESDELALTSAGALALSVDYFVEVCEAYAEAHPGESRPFGMRDHVFPWAIEHGGFNLYGHDLQGEILDLGTPDDISFGQRNWRRYVSPQIIQLKS